MKILTKLWFHDKQLDSMHSYNRTPVERILVGSDFRMFAKNKTFLRSDIIVDGFNI